MAANEVDLVPPRPRIAIERAGRGAPVLFLHGVGGNRSNWSDQLRYFSRRYGCIAWDARGYGASDDDDAPVTMAVFASDLRRVLDHCGIARAHLVGLSMGGMIAQQFWRDHPDRVASLALCDSAPGADDGLTAAQRAEFLKTRKAPLEAGLKPSDIAPAVARSLVGSAASPAAVQRLIDSMSALRTGSYIKALDAIAGWEGIGAIEKIDVPTLVLVGEEDRLTTPVIAHRMASRIPDAELVVLQRTGHLSNIENAPAFNAALERFLAAVVREADA